VPGDPIDAYLDEMRALVDEHGWAVQYVPATHETPPYAYTVGLAAAGERELLVYGLPRDVSHRLCTEAVARQRAEEGLEPHRPYDGLLSGFAAVFLPVPDARNVDEFAMVRRLWRGRDFRALQLVWPDSQGRFPWDPACDAGVVSAQPLRGEPPA
jgi:hypothetical protein